VPYVLGDNVIKMLLQKSTLTHKDLYKIAVLNPNWRDAMEDFFEKIARKYYSQFIQNKPSSMSWFSFYERWLRMTEGTKKSEKDDNM